MKHKLIFMIILIIFPVINYAFEIPKIVTENIQKEEHGIVFNMQIPKLNKNNQLAPASTYNDAIKKIIDGEIKEFKDIVNVSSEQGKSTFNVKYALFKLISSDDVFFSTKLTFSTFVAGGVYHNQFHMVYNFDYKNNKSIDLKDIFITKFNYIKFLNNYCGKRLAKKTQYSLKQLKEGSFLDYSNWNLTQDGLLLTFDEFPHVFGPQKVFVSYQLLKPHMNERFKKLTGLSD